MEASNQTNINPEEQLSELFGSYKAEWLKEKLYDLFTEPAYFPELKTPRPCILIGGRGTGKTTVLRCLSYEGQFVFSGRNPANILEWSYYGMYHRVNTNRVTAFKGTEISQEKWIQLFAHYFNLLLCDLMLRFLEWYQTHLPNSEQLSEHDCKRIARSFNLDTSNSIRDLASKLDNLRIDFEAHINNVASATRPPLSTQGAPIDILAEAVLKLPQFRNKNFFFLLDEYENFEDYQQQIVNTLIKHSGQFYSFKIGIRELGLRRRTTLNENEQLIHPSDYVRINIAEKLGDSKFKEFALAVCNARISKINVQDAIRDVSLSLPELSEDEEAQKLGIAESAESIKRTLYSINENRNSNIKMGKELTSFEAYLIKHWAESKGQEIEEAYKDFLANQGEWQTRLQNYKHALLFTLRRGKRGIVKYYAGWDVFVKLSANNIRYLLELVDQSLLLHLKDGESLSQPVSHDIQTKAAQNVGQKNLFELEGLSVHGANLTKLLLGLGRIFQVMAADLSGHTPEVNQFSLEDDMKNGDDRSGTEVDQLLKSAVMHLALIRFSGNKLVDEGETRDFDYMIHPIYAPFFVFSYRKKRKMKLTAKQLLGLVKNPRETIRDILANSNRAVDESLPEQLNLFEGYYFGRSK